MAFLALGYKTEVIVQRKLSIYRQNMFFVTQVEYKLLRSSDVILFFQSANGRHSTYVEKMNECMNE